MNVERRNPPLISIVIPNLNGINYLPGCLSSIREQTFKEFEVIVVDNGSTDGSVEFIKAGFPQALIIENRENRGFAAANNQGIKAAKGEYIATLNNDTEADRDWLANLYNAAVSSSDRTGMWAPKILSLERRDRIDSVGGLLLYRDGIAKGRGRLEKDTGQYDKARDILIPSACCALYSKKMLKEIGFFDEDFFAYCEDTDLGLRAVLAGWRALSVPGAVIYHHYSGTGGMYSKLKAFLVERNHIWVAWKNFPVSWIITLPYYIALRYAIQLYGAVSGKGSASKFARSHPVKDIIVSLITAYVSAFKGAPLIIKKRRTIKRKISIREFEEIIKKNKISARQLALID